MTQHCTEADASVGSVVRQSPCNSVISVIIILLQHVQCDGFLVLLFHLGEVPAVADLAVIHVQAAGGWEPLEGVQGAGRRRLPAPPTVLTPALALDLLGGQFGLWFWHDMYALMNSSATGATMALP